MMRVFDLLSQALLVSRQDQQQASESVPSNFMPHDHLSQPMPHFMPRGNHSYDAVLSSDVDSAFAGIQWTKDAMQNAREFNAAMQGSRFRTLAEIIDTVVPNCGVTKSTGQRVNVTGMSTMVWQNDKEREGFTHHGPCEAWIDQTRVYQAPNCRVNHGKYPATIPIDYSVCEDNCIFKFYWLSVDEPEWHAYKQCVPITTRTPVIFRTKRPIVARTFVPVKTPVTPRKHIATINNVHVEGKDDSKVDNRRESTEGKKSRRDSDDSDDDRDDDSNGHRRHDSDDKGYSDDSDDSDDSSDDRGHAHHHHSHHDSGDPKSHDDARRPVLPPTYSFYPMNTSMIVSLPYHQFEEKHPHHTDHYDSDEKCGDSDDSDDSDDNDDSRDESKDSDDSDINRDHSQYQHRDDARRTPPPSPSDYRYPAVSTPVAVRHPHHYQAQKKTDQDSTAETTQPVLLLNRLDQNRF